MVATRNLPDTIDTAPPGPDGEAYADAVAAEVEALWDRVVNALVNVGGSANAITAECDPPLINDLVHGQMFWLIPTADNTGAVTIDIDTRGAVDLTSFDGEALVEGDLVTDEAVLMQYDADSGDLRLSVPTRRSFSELPGKLVSRAYATYAANSSLTAKIPFDDTIPQSGEGTEIVTASITPSSASNRVRVTFVGFVSGVRSTGCGDTYTAMSAALFRDSVAAALHATAIPNETALGGTPHSLFGGAISFAFEEVPATTSAIIYKVRAGPDGVGTPVMRFNGSTGARRFGGVAAAVLILEEITP